MTEFCYKQIKPKGAVKKLIIFLHGYTSFADDVYPYAEILAKNLENTLIVMPEADMPSERHPEKKQWYPLTDIDPDDKNYFIDDRIDLVEMSLEYGFVPILIDREYDDETTYIKIHNLKELKEALEIMDKK